MNKKCTSKWIFGATSAAACFIVGLSASVQVRAADLALSNVPLFVTTAARPNILITLDNSNSMDEAPSGRAVGSDSPDSKSEIARKAVIGIVKRYKDRYRMGLMAYQQENVSKRQLHDSQYDVSFNPANYDPNYSGGRDSSTKKYRVANPSDPGNYLYYNVALPFYSSYDEGNGFCYSKTADFDNGSEDPVNGPWDTYRCFHDKTGTSDVVPANSGADETSNGWVNFFSSSKFSPTDSDLAQGILDFGTFLTWQHVGDTWFSNSSPGRGYLHIPIKLLDSTQVQAFEDKLATSQFSSATDTPLRNAGLTPIEGTLLTAKDYFTGGLSDSAEGGSVSKPEESCGANYNVLVTDGLPSTDKDGNELADTTTAVSDAAAAASALKDAGVPTYILGFALPSFVNSSLLNQIASSGGTGTSFFADDSSSLTTALDDIFDNIERDVGSAAAVSLNTGVLTSNTFLYQTRFNSATWSGQLKAFPVQSDGTLGSQAWDSAEVLKNQDWDTGRSIITSNGTSAYAFRWSDLNSAQHADLNDNPDTTPVDNDSKGSDRLEYLRGNTSKEGTGSGQFRTRSTPLGDLIHSAAVYVGPPSFGYPASLESSAYDDFKSAHYSREQMIYVGGNDGMLHGFDANNGKEKLAYVPSVLYGRLPALTSQNYNNNHQYYVDGSPTVGDAFVNSAWKSVLVSGLRGGGQAVFALDVTNPANFSEGNASSIFMWEFNDSDDADLGYTYGQPAIVKLHNGKWAAVFGNGYNATESDGHASTTGHGYLYIVFLDHDPSTSPAWTNDYIKIDTGVGTVSTPNGIGTVAPVDTNGDNVVDYIYAGDLYGNLWKFDLTSSNSNQWTNSSKLTKLFHAEDSSGNSQPITARPEITSHPVDGKSGYMVYFGTGKYLETTDNNPANVGQQSFYGIWDNGSSVSRSDLVQQQVIDTVDNASGQTFRRVTGNTIDWSTDLGWYMDFPTTTELVASPAIATSGRIVFVTTIPSSDVCAYGGSGWLMELDMSNGGRVSQATLDYNNDGVVNSSDLVDYTDSNGDTTQAGVGGMQSGVGLLSRPSILRHGNQEYKYMSGSSGSIQSAAESANGSATGRTSWRQLR